MANLWRALGTVNANPGARGYSSNSRLVSSRSSAEPSNSRVPNPAGCAPPPGAFLRAKAKEEEEQVRRGRGTGKNRKRKKVGKKVGKKVRKVRIKDNEGRRNAKAGEARSGESNEAGEEHGERWREVPGGSTGRGLRDGPDAYHFRLSAGTLGLSHFGPSPGTKGGFTISRREISLRLSSSGGGLFKASRYSKEYRTLFWLFGPLFWESCLEGHRTGGPGET